MVGLKSDVGIRRKLNEDYADCIENDEYKLYIVADGMGGHNAGEVASKMAVDEIREYIKNNFSHGNEVKVLEDAVHGCAGCTQHMDTSEISLPLW